MWTLWARAADDLTWRPLGQVIPGSASPGAYSYEANVRGGPSSMSLDVWLDSQRLQPILLAGTDVQLWHDSVPVWRGMIARTPTSRGTLDRRVSVECVGTYQALEWATTDKLYVLANGEGFRDSRLYVPTQVGSYFRMNGTTSTGDKGEVKIGWAEDTRIKNPDFVGVTLDLGANARVKRVVAGIRTSNNTADTDYYLGMGNNINPRNSSVTANAALNAAATATQTISASGSNQYRYVHFYLRNAVAGTTTAQRYAMLDGSVADFLVLGDTAWGSSSGSSLLASQVIDSQLDAVSTVVDANRGRISASSTVLPEYYPGQRMSVRQVIEEVNTYDSGYAFRLTSDASPVAVYGALPTKPRYVIGQWDAYQWDAGDANSIDEQASRVIVGYENKNSLLDAEAIITDDNVNLGGVAFPNASFDTNTASWSVAGLAGTPTLTRDTAVYDTASASGRVNSGVASEYGCYVETTLTGTFVAGRVYNITARMRIANVTTGDGTLTIWASDGTSWVDDGMIGVTAGTWYTVSISITSDGTAPTITLGFLDAAASWGVGTVVGYVDSCAVTAQTQSITSRLGVNKDIVVYPNRALTSTTATTIGQAIFTRATAPTKRGELTIGRYIAEFDSGQIIPAARIQPGESVLLADMRDPTTGGYGYIGVIANAAISEDGSAKLTIDDDRNTLDAILERYGG